jgi:hypothetical protein
LLDMRLAHGPLDEIVGHLLSFDIEVRNENLRQEYSLVRL